jgi:hypothetical protein
MQTDTPETDAIQGNGIHQVTDAFDHARKLERERNEALELLKTFQTTPNHDHQGNRQTAKPALENEARPV